MASDDLLRLLNRCLVDKGFCSYVLNQPQEAAKPYRLLPIERDLLLYSRANSLLELVDRIQEAGLALRTNWDGPLFPSDDWQN